MWLSSVELNGFYGSSFSHGIRLESLGHINVLIGPNNSGKSIPSRVFSTLSLLSELEVISPNFQSRIAKHMPAVVKETISSKARYKQDRYSTLKARLSITAPVRRNDRPWLMGGNRDTTRMQPPWGRLLMTLPNAEHLIDKDSIFLGYQMSCTILCNSVEISFRSTAEDDVEVITNPLIKKGEKLKKYIQVLDESPTNKFLTENEDYEQSASNYAPAALDMIQNLRQVLQSCRFFEPKRDLESQKRFYSISNNSPDSEQYEERLKSAASKHISGALILDKLAQLENSEFNSDQQKFAKIAREINSLLEVGSSEGFERFHVTEKDEFGCRKLQLVYHDKSVISFDNFGTGISALVILLSDIFLNPEQSIYFLEEPEQHLHPGLLVRLINFLKNNCPYHQFFISTHSHTLLDCLEREDRLYRISQTKSGCVATRCNSFEDKHRLLDALGLRASSMMLVNNVIWVEGPSDVSYLRFWLERIKAENELPPLLENSDYTIVQYGGSCVSHICAEEEDSDNESKLSMLRLCRRAIFLADKDLENDKLKPTIHRLQNEFQGHSNRLFLTTSHREIEDEIPQDILKLALKSTFPKVLKDFPFETLSLQGEGRIPDKIKASTRINSYRINTKRDFCTVYDESKVRLAENVVNLLKESESITIPSYINAIAEFILAGRSPELADEADEPN